MRHHYDVIFVKIFLAAVLKFICGCDDVLWLTPFMAKANRLQKWGVGARYVLSVSVLTVLAVVISITLNVVLENTSHKENNMIRHIISFAAAGLLFSYALASMITDGYFDSCRRPKTFDDNVSLLESEQSKYGSEDKDGEVDGKSALSSFLETVFCVEATSADDHLRINDVIVVACLGSTDDFIVYVSLALSGVFAWYELVPGIFLGATVIAACVGIMMESSEYLAAHLAKIPVPVVLMGLSVFIVLAVFFPILP